MECEPSVSDEMVNAATPPPANVALPIAAAPSLNVTVPVGVPPALVTVAVKVTACLSALGLTDEASEAVVAGAALTVWVSAGDVLAEKLMSPLYSAVIVCGP